MTGWGDTAPEWLKNFIALEMLVEIIKVAKG